MATEKISVHLVNEKGAIICPNKTGRHKATRDAWDKLDPKEQCGNCRRVFARRQGKERISFGTVSPGKKTSTSSTAASYTPRYGQV